MTTLLVKPALDPRTLEEKSGSLYPPKFAKAVSGRSKRALGDAFGLRDFGVNLVRLAPGAWSAQRHWHTLEDEFVYVLRGELTLITDEGEQRLSPGMTAGFKAGTGNGHHLVNHTDSEAEFLVVGTRNDNDAVHYPDIDLFYHPGTKSQNGFSRKNGEPVID